MSNPKVEVKTLDDLQPDPNNVNKHTQKGHALVENSLRKRGAFRSVAAAGKGVDKPVVMAGNLTIEKARDAGFEEVIFVHTNGRQLVSVIRDDIEPGSPEAIALGIEDNESGKQSYSPDIDVLAALAAGDNAILSALREDDKIFDGMIKGMGLKDEAHDAPADVDRAAELLEKWQVKPGDLWQIGDHRLICGDCTDAATVARVMDGEKATVLFTDPPYKMGTQGGDILQQKRLESHERIKDIVDFDPQPFLEMLPSLFGERLCAFVFCNKELLPDYLLWARNNKINFNVLVWKKSVVVPFGDSHRPDIEYLVLFRKNAKWNNGLAGVSYSRLLEYDSEQGDHPTIKPADLIQNQLLIVSDEGDTVADTYLGSGSTLVACENLGRIGRGIDKDPKYVAVALERMATAFPALEIKKL